MTAIDEYRRGTGDPYDLIAIRERWQSAYPHAEVRVREVYNPSSPYVSAGLFIRLRLDGYCTHASNAYRGPSVPVIPAVDDRGIPYWHRVTECRWALVPDPDQSFVETT